MDGKVAVVTGGASGIGRASALALVDAGARVVVADVDEAGLEQTVAQCGGKAIGVPTDVTSAASVDALVATAIERMRGFDVMCNVAGILTRAKLVELTEAELDRVLAVNVKGVLFGVQAALRNMRAGGAVVNVASSAIDQAGPALAAYSMSKAAVASLTKTAAVEAGRLGIRVNGVAPGFVLTPMTSRGDAEQTQAMAEMMRQRSPLGANAEAEDIAAAIVYLASDAARSVTGQILRVNGGSTMPW